MDYADTESIMNLVLFDPVPPYPGLANAQLSPSQLSPFEQLPPAYEHPPSYASVVGHHVGTTTQIAPVQVQVAIAPIQVVQPADAGAFGRIRKAYARAKKWARIHQPSSHCPSVRLLPPPSAFHQARKYDNVGKNTIPPFYLSFPVAHTSFYRASSRLTPTVYYIVNEA
ncbi:hypothetical protein B0H12DRAFT_1078478 [Mycena haematopus]|nr:hypothetical protein B0H12DRAFT_1078478 [Mycena haematopus]